MIRAKGPGKSQDMILAGMDQGDEHKRTIDQASKLALARQ
jgi:hypothetical protein